ncbi:MAG: ubiquinone biosynthesis protein [Micrococcales bacterium 70-64]|nr:class I SAM-dependent methyltransferase [Leifsonia sp.]ODU64875.1 MAG: ubiquinone biosynthesis protein [Leifsonia sp. SCN 70-46]OJX86567.1 MAG: ubiquinone biosynthesis protein [Micrococcales bacterium 70-64]
MARFPDGSAGDADYGSIGAGYALIRQPDPRIAAQFHAALGDARTVLNVGAGAGSYEPLDRDVTAVEPSASMRAQRPATLSPAVDATSQDLPFADDTFDASMASVTVHQWPELERGLGEMRRVTRGPVAILTFDPVPPVHWWLIDYVPELFEVEAGRMPALDRIAAALGGSVDVRTVLVPADCTDRFGQALFARPEQLLDADVRRAMSAWSFVPDEVVQRFLDALSADLASGAWDEKYGAFRTLPEFDGGLRLVVGMP